MRRILKLAAYSDIILILQILKDSLKISSLLNSGYMLSSVNISINPNVKSKYSLEKLSGYVGICLRIRGLFRCKDACLMRSLILCKTLRKNGIDAKINFGTRKNEDTSQVVWGTQGHCWVTTGHRQVDHNYPFTFQYP